MRKGFLGLESKVRKLLFLLVPSPSGFVRRCRSFLCGFSDLLRRGVGWGEVRLELSVESVLASLEPLLFIHLTLLSPLLLGHHALNALGLGGNLLLHGLDGNHPTNERRISTWCVRVREDEAEVAVVGVTPDGPDNLLGQVVPVRRAELRLSFTIKATQNPFLNHLGEVAVPDVGQPVLAELGVPVVVHRQNRVLSVPNVVGGAVGVKPLNGEPDLQSGLPLLSVRANELQRVFAVLLVHVRVHIMDARVAERTPVADRVHSSSTLHDRVKPRDPRSQNGSLPRLQSERLPHGHQGPRNTGQTGQDRERNVRVHGQDENHHSRDHETDQQGLCLFHTSSLVIELGNRFHFSLSLFEFQ